jgi:hypothetical protein
VGSLPLCTIVVLNYAQQAIVDKTYSITTRNAGEGSSQMSIELHLKNWLKSHAAIDTCLFDH